MPTTFQKAERRYKLENGWSDIISYATSSASVEMSNGTDLQTKMNSVDTAIDGKLSTSLKGASNGLAELDANGKVPSSQLPSYVDDIIEGYYYNNKFYKESTHTTEITGETGKIYVDLSTEKTYRWSGTAYIEISESLALGETDSTAYRGDRGKIAYEHSQSAHAPSNAEENQNAFSNIQVGQTTIQADSKTDTLNIVAGNNVTITPSADNDSITISSEAGTEVYVDEETILKDEDDVISVNEFVGTLSEFQTAEQAGQIEDNATVYITDDGSAWSGGSIVAFTIAAADWSNNAYTFSSYSASDYNIEIYTSSSMTLAQYNAFIDAKIVGNSGSNTITALNGSPSIDIPVLLKITQL